MKLIIDIPDETYDYWKKHKHEYVLSEAIANGTPYNPTGDLISREALRKEVTERVNFTTVDGHIVYDKTLELIDNAPTIFDKNAFSQGYKQATCDAIADIQKVINNCPNCGASMRETYEKTSEDDPAK